MKNYKNILWTFAAAVLLGAVVVAACNRKDDLSGGSDGVTIGTVTGTVTDSVAGTPVGGVAITISQGIITLEEAETSLTGTYTFADMPKEELLLTFEKEGYRATTRTIAASDFVDHVATVNVALVDTTTSGKPKEPDDPDDEPFVSTTLAEENVYRAIQLVDTTMKYLFVRSHLGLPGLRMSNAYNPFRRQRMDVASVWSGYTTGIEAVAAVLNALNALHYEGYRELHDRYYDRYTRLLDTLVTDLRFFEGTFTLESYTQTKQWTVYGVNRSNIPHQAAVTGVANVYDDQMWLVREFLQAYAATGDARYLEKAEYLTAYVLDGWDCTRHEATGGNRVQGHEFGGIPWGPGYVSKHSCSNGPMVGPLVWLHELYKNRADQIEHRYIDSAPPWTTRTTRMMSKSDYYLYFAEKIYVWQKRWLIIGSGRTHDGVASHGIYNDAMHGCNPGSVGTTTVGGVNYRAGNFCTSQSDRPHSYNTGSMISGAVDLYRATGKSEYLNDVIAMSDRSYEFFSTHNRSTSVNTSMGTRREWANDGFANWFNGVLVRAYAEAYPLHPTAATYLSAFQEKLDYAWDNHRVGGFLPTRLLRGWHSDPENTINNVYGMAQFTFAAKYAVLAEYELEK